MGLSKDKVRFIALAKYIGRVLDETEDEEWWNDVKTALKELQTVQLNFCHSTGLAATIVADQKLVSMDIQPNVNVVEHSIHGEKLITCDPVSTTKSTKELQLWRHPKETGAFEICYSLEAKVELQRTLNNWIAAIENHLVYERFLTANGSDEADLVQMSHVEKANVELTNPAEIKFVALANEVINRLEETLRKDWWVDIRRLASHLQTLHDSFHNREYGVCIITERNEEFHGPQPWEGFPCAKEFHGERVTGAGKLLYEDPIEGAGAEIGLWVRTKAQGTLILVDKDAKQQVINNLKKWIRAVESDLLVNGGFVEYRDTKSDDRTQDKQTRQKSEDNSSFADLLRKYNITDRQSKLLLELFCKGANSKKTLMQADIISKVIDKFATAQDIKSDMSILKKLKYVDSQTGRGGGSWLTVEGSQISSELKSKTV